MNQQPMTEPASLDRLKETIKNQPGVLVYFYNDRCAPCVSLRPKVISLVEKEFTKIKLVFINSEKSPDIPAHYGVFSNPAILLFIEGREYLRKSKYISESELREDIGRLYAMAFE